MQIVFFAMSSMATAFLILYILIKLLEKVSITKLLKYTVSVFASIYIIKLYFFKTRLGILFDYLVDSPDKLINIDVSINSRVGHLIFSLLGAWDSWFEPQGFNKFADYLDSKLVKVSWYEWLGGYDSDMRIMSGFGGAIYELGIFGLFYVIATFISAGSNKIQKPSMILYGIYIILIMLTAQPLTYPLFGVTIGMLMLKIPEKYDATNLSRSHSFQSLDR